MKSNLIMPALWLALTAICVLFILAGLRATLKSSGWKKQRQKKTLFAVTVMIMVWIAGLLLLSYNGFFADFSRLPPRPALAMLIPLPLVLLFSFSKRGTQLLQFIPAHWLVLLQSFRIIVELLLLAAFLRGLLPVQMTLDGRNFDIVTGILALPVGYWMARNRGAAKRVAILFNIVGLLLLLNILIIALLSMPTPLRHFMNEPANTLVGQFPFILLPGVLVPLAYSLHIFSLRQLLVKRNPDHSRLIMNSHRERVEARLQEMTGNI